MLARPEYKFVSGDSHLGRNILFVTFGGSYAYGTNVETSDIDIRGCTLNSKSDIIGISQEIMGNQSFEQFIDQETDTTIYAFNKLIGLLCNCNPNVIEMFGCLPEHYAMVSKIGKEFLDNKHMFLSQKASHSFGGYANAQLRRLENNLARHTLPESEKQRHIVTSCEYAIQTFNERYTKFPNGSLRLYTDSVGNTDTDIYMDVSLARYPLRDYVGAWNELRSIAKDFDKINGRNKKKDDLHLNKHAMHLVRLYLMFFDIFEKEEIITYRADEHELLMDIRTGKFQTSQGDFRHEFYDILNEYEKRMQYDRANTSLPEYPNYKDINDFVMSVNERVITGEC